MPGPTQLVIAHFKGVNLQSDEMIKNAIVIPWISPEQTYYIDRQSMQAIVDLINKTFDSNSSSIHTVISGSLQRFNYFCKKYDETPIKEAEMATWKAIELGRAWYRDKKDIITQLIPKHHKIAWEEIIQQSSHQEAKKIMDDVYKENSEYQQSCLKTSEIFIKAKRGKDEVQVVPDISIYNSQEYLREECAFLYALPKLFPEAAKEGKRIYIVYPNDPSPAIRFTMQLIEQSYPGAVQWLCADLKTKPADTKKFNLQDYLRINPHHGCSSCLEEAMKTKKSPQLAAAFFPSSSHFVCPPALSPTTFASVVDKKSQADAAFSRFIQESMLQLSSVGSSPPKETASVCLSQFFEKVSEIGSQFAQSLSVEKRVSNASAGSSESPMGSLSRSFVGSTSPIAQKTPLRTSYDASDEGNKSYRI